MHLQMSERPKSRFLFLSSVFVDHFDADNCRIPDIKNIFLSLLPGIKDRKALLGEVPVEFFHWPFS